MSSHYRQQNGNGSRTKVSHLNGRRKGKVTSPLALLVKRCVKNPNLAKALFVTVLFSWVGIVALFLSNLPSKHGNTRTMSPLTARDNQSKQLRAPSAFKRLLLGRRGSSNPNAGASDVKANGDGDTVALAEAKTPPVPATPAKNLVVKKPPPMKEERSALKSKHHREQVGNAILARLPGYDQLKPPRMNNAKQMQERLQAGGLRKMRLSSRRNNASFHQNQHSPKRPAKLTLESIKQSTQDALISSIPHVQKSSDGDVSLSSNSVHAFAAEDYFDRKTMMNDNDDSLDTYYAIDDDYVRGKSVQEYRYGNHKGESVGNQQFCSTPSFYRLYRPNCNELHSTVSTSQWLTGEEYQANDHRSRFLGAGTYRQVFLLERQFALDTDEVVFKSMKRFERGSRPFEQRAAYSPEEAYKNFELYDDMRKDSMVMELLSSSPRIADIYSFCGLSSIIEYAPGNIEKFVLPTDGEKDNDDDPTPVNDIKPQKKLSIALELAKGIATMHGHSGGIIANVDVQVGQFCRGKDGLIKILDFNRAEVMLYDEKQQEYCKFENGPPPDGKLRAPEEIIDAPLNEKIDVYSLGNVFYSILTGLFVNDDYSIHEAHRRITHGQTEEIDVDYFESRSPEELALVKAIQWCWTFKADERPSIFEIVEFLEEELRKSLNASSED